MKKPKVILELYGKCCVSEYALTKDITYEDSDEGRNHRRRDDNKLENIRGQKQTIEWLFE